MKKALFLILVIVSSQSFSQFSTTEKKGKTGLKFEDQLIVKPKFDSINTTDKEIATAYKKSSVFYYNQEGDKIAKKKIPFAAPFEDGFAIISTKKNKYGAIDKAGKLILPLSFIDKPKQYGRLILAEKTNNHYYLYNPESKISIRVDSIQIRQNWLIGFEKKSVYHHHIKEGFLGKKKDQSYYSYDLYFNLYDFKRGELILDSVIHYYHDQDYTIHTRKDSSVVVLDKSDRVLVRGAYSDIQVNGNSLYCTLEEYEKTEIRSLSGKLIRNDLLFITNIDENRYIFQIDSLQFIGNELGEQLSPKMKGFGPVTNGWRIVFKDYTYTYMNDSTYELLPFKLPVILGNAPTSQGSSSSRWIFGRGFRNLKTKIGNFGRGFLGKPKRLLETGSYSHSIKKDKKIVFQFPVEGEYIQVVINTLDSNQVYTDFIEDDHNFRAQYNYINLTGELVNNEHYSSTSPIINDRFIGSYRTKYLVVSTNGENLTQEFDWIKKDTCGYYLTKLTNYPTKYGLLDSNLNEVLPCKFIDLTYIDGAFYQVDYRGKKRLRYKIPE